MVQKVPLSALAVAQTYYRPLWSRLAWSMGILVVACTGTRILFKKVFLRTFKLWIHNIISQKNFEQMHINNATVHSINAVKSASSAATEVIRVNREIMKFHAEEKRHFHDIIRALETQTHELNKTMIAMRDVIKEKGRQNNLLTKEVQSYGNWYNSDVNVIKEPVSQKLFTDSTRASGQLPAIQSSKPDHAPHSKSYLEVLAILERGEKPPGIQEIDDKPPNPHQAPSESRLLPKRKPWEIVNVNKRDNVGGRRNSGLATHSSSSLTVASTQKTNHIYELPVTDSNDEGILAASRLWTHRTNVATPLKFVEPETGLYADVNMLVKDETALVSSTPLLSVISDDESLNGEPIIPSQYTSVPSQAY